MCVCLRNLFIILFLKLKQVTNKRTFLRLINAINFFKIFLRFIFQNKERKKFNCWRNKRTWLFSGIVVNDVVYLFFISFFFVSFQVTCAAKLHSHKAKLIQNKFSAVVFYSIKKNNQYIFETTRISFSFSYSFSILFFKSFQIITINT